MVIELDEADEAALIAVVRSYRRAVSERGLDCDVTPDSLVSALVRREAETVAQAGARALGVSFARPGALA